MSNNLIGLDNVPMIEEFFVKLKDKRAYYIMDRIVLSQLAFLQITGIVTSLIIIVKIQNVILNYWYLWIFALSSLIISISIFKNKQLGPSKTWQEALIPNLLLWCVITICLGVIFDEIFGFGTTFWVSIFISMYYVAGYVLARMIRLIRFKFSKTFWLFTVPIFCLSFCLIIFFSGLKALDEIVNKYQIKSFFLHDYGKFLNHFQCAISIFYMVSGFGITVSMLLNYAAFVMLTEDIAKSNVIYKAPSKLFFNYLIGTSIITFIFWIFLEIFIPPVIGGGGRTSGGGGGSGGGSSQQTFDNILNELEETNQVWGNLIIPITYMPFIFKILEEKHQKLKKKMESRHKKDKKYYIQHISGYKSNYSPYGKHYSTNYSQYKGLDQPIKRIYQPIEQLNEYKKNLANKYGLKKI